MGNEQSQDQIGFRVTDDSERIETAGRFQHQGVEGRMLDKPTLPHNRSASPINRSRTKQNTTGKLTRVRESKHDAAVNCQLPNNVVADIRNRPANPRSVTSERKDVSKTTSGRENEKISSTQEKSNVHSQPRSGKSKNGYSNSSLPVRNDNKVLKTSRPRSTQEHQTLSRKENRRSARTERKTISLDNKPHQANINDKTSPQRKKTSKASLNSTPQTSNPKTNIASSESKDKFPDPPGFDELSGLDLSHLSIEERTAILQVAARAKQIEQVEQQKIRKIEDQVALYSHNARQNVTKPPSETNSTQDRRNAEVKVRSTSHDEKPREQVSTKKNASVTKQRVSAEKLKNECYLCSKQLDTDPNTAQGDSQRKTSRSKSVGASQESKELELVIPSSGNCSYCGSLVCSECVVRSTLLGKGLLCILCAKQRELVACSNLWLKSTKKSYLHRSQSADTSLTPVVALEFRELTSNLPRSQRSHSESGQGKVVGSDTTSGSGSNKKKLERKRSQSDPSSHAKTRRDSLAKTSHGSKRSVQNLQKSEKNSGKQGIEAQSLVCSKLNFMAEATNSDKVNSSKRLSKTKSLSANPVRNLRRSSLERQTTVDDRASNVAKHQTPLKSITETWNSGTVTNFEPQSLQTKPKNGKMSSSNSNTHAPKRINDPSLSESLSTAPTTDNNIRNKESVKQTVRPFSARNETTDSTLNPPVVDQHATTGEVLTSEAAVLRDQSESLHSTPTQSVANTQNISTTSASDSGRKEKITKTPSALPRKNVGRNDETKTSVRKKGETYKTVDPPKVTPRNSSISIATSGDDKSLKNESHEMTSTMSKNTFEQGIEDHHYHMEENDTEGDFDCILSYTSEAKRTGCGSSGSQADGRRDKDKHMKSDMLISNVSHQTREITNEVSLNKVTVPSSLNRLQEKTNTKVKVETNSAKTHDITKSRVPSKSEFITKMAGESTNTSGTFARKFEEQKDDKTQTNDQYMSKSTIKIPQSVLSGEVLTDGASPCLVKPPTSKYRRMPLPSTTSSTAYTIKQPQGPTTTEISRKWQIADQLSDLDTDLQDFQEKMKENMRILSGDATPTSLTESDDEDEMLRSATTSIPTFPTSTAGQRGGFSSFQPHRTGRDREIGAKPKKLANMFMKRTTSTDSFSDLLKQTVSSPRSSRRTTMTISKPIRNTASGKTSLASSNPYLSPNTEHHCSVKSIPNKTTLDIEQGDNCCDRRHSLPGPGDSSHVRSTFSDPCDLRSQGNMQHSPIIAVTTHSDDLIKKKLESSIQANNLRMDNEQNTCGTNGVGVLAEGLARCFSCGTISTQAISSSTPMDVKTRIVSGTSRYSPVTVTPKPNIRSVDSSTQVSPMHEDSHSNSFADGGLTLSDLKKIKTLIEALNDTRDIDELVASKQSKERGSVATKLHTRQTNTASTSHPPPQGVSHGLGETTTSKNISYLPAEFPAPQTQWCPNGSQLIPPSLGNWTGNQALHTQYPIRNHDFSNTVAMHPTTYFNPLSKRVQPGYCSDEMESSHETMDIGAHPHCHTRLSYDGVAPSHVTHHLPNSSYYYNRSISSPYYDYNLLPSQTGKLRRYHGDCSCQGQTRDCSHHLNYQPITTQPRSTSLQRNEFNDMLPHRGHPVAACGRQRDFQSRDASVNIDWEKSPSVSPMPQNQQHGKPSRARGVIRPTSSIQQLSNLRKCSSVPTGLNSDQSGKISREIADKHVRPPSSNPINNAASVHDEGPDDIDHYYQNLYHQRNQYLPDRSRRGVHQSDSEYSDNDVTDYYEDNLYRDEEFQSSNAASFEWLTRPNRGRLPLYPRRTQHYDRLSNEPAHLPIRCDTRDRSRRKRSDKYYNSRPFPRSYSIQRDYDFPRSTSRRSLPEPPEDDEYSWRYERAKLLNSMKFPRGLSNTSHSNRSERRRTDQIEVNRLQQTMDDLDQEERELDLRLKYLEVGRSRRSTMNSTSLHDDLLQGRDYRFREDLNRHSNQTHLEAKSRGFQAKEPDMSLSLAGEGSSSRSVSIYDFISRDTADTSSKQDDRGTHRTSSGSNSTANYEVVKDTRDILSSTQQPFNTDRPIFHNDVHHSAVERFDSERGTGWIPTSNRHTTGTDYQSRHRRRVEANAAGGEASNQRRSRRNSGGSVSNFAEFQLGLGFDNDSYYSAYFSQHDSYRLPPRSRFFGYQDQTKNQPSVHNTRDIYTTSSSDKKALQKNTDSKTMTDRAYAELASLDIGKSGKEKIHVTREQAPEKAVKTHDRQNKQFRMKLELLDDDMRSVVSDSEAYHLGKETTTWFDKPSDDEMP